MQAVRQKFKKATSTRKGRVFLAIILVILLLAVAGIIYWQTHKKKIIRDKLESAIQDKSGGLYSIKYETLDLDEVTGYLSVTNLTLEYDSLKYQALVKADQAPPILLKIHVPELTVVGVQTPKALIDKEINGKKLEIKNPTIEILYTMQGKDSARNVPTKEIYEQILGNLNQIVMDTVSITGAHITTRNLKKKRANVELTGANVQLIGIQVDSAANADTTRLLFAREANISCEELVWWSTNKLYKYGIKGVAVNSATRDVHVNSFAIEPQLAEDAFVRSLPTQDDRFDFLLRDIVLRNIDFPQLMEEEVTADSILIGSGTFKIYRDLNMPRDTKNRVGTYPHQSITKLAIPVFVKKIILSNAFIEYKERSAITKQAGKVQFYNAYATISNLTNRKEAIAKNNTMSVDINTRFLNKTPFKVSWHFYLGNPGGRFTVKGNLGSINAKDLNVLAEPMGPARIEDGRINSLQFDLAGNDYSMNGTVQLLYDDLKVALLEKDKDSKEWDKKNLTSFLANLLIKNSNPPGKNKEPKTVTVTNERDTNRSIFHLSWKTLFKGVKETIGVKK